MDELGLQQSVNECTWERTVKNKVISSILDHTYIPNNLYKVTTVDLQIGDHKGILVTNSQHNERGPKPNKTLRRLWSKYSPEKLLDHINVNFLNSLNSESVELHNLLLSQHLMSALEK